MASIRKSLEHAAGIFPSIRRLLAERDLLNRENEALRKNLRDLTSEVQALRTRFQTAWQQVPGLWQPPGHFYSPIPSISELKMDEEEIFKTPPRIRGVDLNEKTQLDLLHQFGAYYREQPFTAQATPGRRYFFENPNYSYSHAITLLREGVYIHFHDVFYPFEYLKEWVYEGRAWNEAYLLRAFMQYNRAFEIQFFTSFLLDKHREIFESLMPLCLKCPGANLWLKKTLHDVELDRATEKSERRPRTVPDVIEPFRKEHSPFLGDGWHEAEANHCWMMQSAEVTIGGLETRREITISGFSPLDAAQLSAHIGDTPAGEVELGPSGQFTAKFRVPECESGRSPATIRLFVDRLHHAPGDPRKLGLSVTRIEAC